MSHSNDEEFGNFDIVNGFQVLANPSNIFFGKYRVQLQVRDNSSCNFYSKCSTRWFTICWKNYENDFAKGISIRRTVLRNDSTNFGVKIAFIEMNYL